MELHSRGSNYSNVSRNVQSYILVPDREPLKRDLTIIGVYIYIYIYTCVYVCVEVHSRGSNDSNVNRNVQSHI